MSEHETINVIEKMKVRDSQEENLIPLSTGVILRGKKVSPSLLIEVITSARRPKPPRYFNKQMGREMENLDDPDYIEQVQAYKYEQAGAMVTSMILMGTEIVSIPEGLEGPHPTTQKPKKGKAETVWPAWISEYELLGLPMRADNESWRYLTWVKFRAAPEDGDLKSIQEVVGRLSGINKTDVESAEEFPGRDKKDR